MYSKRRTLQILSVVLMLLLSSVVVLTACGEKTAPSSPSAATTTSAPKELVIGSVLPISGPLSTVGMIWSRGLQCYYDKLNEDGGINIGGQVYKVKYISEDDKDSAEAGAAAARKLVYQDGAKFIYAAIMEPVIEAVYGICEQSNVLQIIPSINLTGHPSDVSPKKPLLVRPNINLDDTHTIDFDFLKATYPNVKNVAISVSDTGFEPMIEDCKYVAQQRGMTINYVEKWAWDTIDFVPVYTRVIASKPDAIMIMISGQSPDELRAIRQLGFTGPVFGNCPLGAEVHVNVVEPQYCTDFFCNGFDPEAPTPAMAELMKIYAEKYKGEDYISDSIMAWDEAWVLTQVMLKAQSVDPLKVIATFDTLTNLGDLQVSTGPARMGGIERLGVNRALVRPIPLTYIMNGKMELIGYKYGSNR